MVKIKANDTRPLPATLTANGSPVNLTGAVVRFHMRPKVAGVGSVVDALATIEDALAGRVSYPWAPADVNVPGIHRAEFEVTFADGTVETFPNSDWIDIEILADLA